MSEDYTVVDLKDVHVHVCACGQVATTRFMTGQEWLSRFEAEYPYNKEDPYYDPDALKAARRASGVDHE